MKNEPPVSLLDKCYKDFSTTFNTDYRSNNNINNLEWVTHEQNQNKRNPYTENRKQRLTKQEMQQFINWYVNNKERLSPLPNQKISDRCKEEIGIDINIQTVLLYKRKL